MYNSILNTCQPDKDLEYFWLSFKSSIYQSLNDIERNNIDQLSNKLNLLQSEKRYVEIEKYIKEHLESFCYNLILSNDSYHLRLLNTNIKRWINIIGKDVCNYDDIFYCILNIYLHATRNSDSKYKEVINIIIDLSKTRDKQYIHKLMNYCIQHKLFNYIDKLKNIIDIKIFIEDDSELRDAYIYNTRAHKLWKHLRIVEYIKTLT